MKEETKVKRCGVVKLGMRYVVDLDDEEMVEEAKQCLYEDITFMLYADELFAAISVETDTTVSELDIPDFLKEEVEDAFVLDSEEEE